MRALKRFVMAPQEELIRVTTQAHEGIETSFTLTPQVTTQAHEGIETKYSDYLNDVEKNGNNSSP